MSAWVMQGLMLTWCAWVVVITVLGWVIFYEIKEMKKCIAAIESELKQLRGTATLRRALVEKIEKHVKKAHENEQ